MREVIWPSVRAAFIAFSSPLEGVIPWLYLDVKGLVTTAIGVLVDSPQAAAALPFVRHDGSPATRAEIADEWARIKGHRELAQQGARAARALCQLRLTDEGVERVVLAKLDVMVEALARRFPDIVSWPAPAQLATISLAWACGAGFAFPKLEAALRRRDFGAASVECTIREAGNAGVAPRNRANRRLYQLAARAVAEGLCPSLLPEVVTT